MHLLIANKHKWLLLLLFLLLLTTFNFNNSNLLNLFFKIKNIEYVKTSYVEENIKSEAMDFLYNKNLFLINKNKIKDLFSNSIWVERIEIKKIFPNQLNILITEYFPIAYFVKNNQMYIINNNFKSSIIFNDINTANLLRIENADKEIEYKLFLQGLIQHNDFYRSLKEVRFIYKDRWDLKLNDGTLIKLGAYSLEEQINNIKIFSKKNNLKLIDLRTKDRVIISNE
jgi:cell division septal protein FtsQ